MDKRARRAIAAALDAAGGDLGGEIIHDLAGPAVYRLEPTALTIAACSACQYVGLIPSIPRKPRLVWTCSSCRRGYALEPPARVWVEGSRPQVVH